MRGIIYTEFMDMIEADYGYALVDKIIESSDLASEGIYTSIGAYPDEEFFELLTNLSTEVGIDAQIILKTFGQHLFKAFLKGYTNFFTVFDNALDFIRTIETYLSEEVLKFYPDAKPPTFKCIMHKDGSLEMIYTSSRKLSALLEGFLEKTIEYYGTPCNIKREKIAEDGSVVRFTISKVK